MNDAVQKALNTVEELCGRYQIAALNEFLRSCRVFAGEEILSIAVLGRFKAGKSSFLNSLIGRAVLPVGVVPVTSVVTEVGWGSRERVTVEFSNGRVDDVPIADVGEFVAEDRNPQNAKGVLRVSVELPELERFRGIRLVDTPGLESVFAHNTDTALDWLPNAGLALVAVGVDPPLSSRDIELIEQVRRYTPKVAVILTKADLVSEAERQQVLCFVEGQLNKHWDGAVPVYPYSVRPNFENLRTAFDDCLLSEARSKRREQHRSILIYKLARLVSECRGYLGVSLKAAEVGDVEREALRAKVVGDPRWLEEAQTSIRLTVRHQIGSLRPSYEALLQGEEAAVQRTTRDGLARAFPQWSNSLAEATEGFQDWLRADLTQEISRLSTRHREAFLAPLHGAEKQVGQSLQDFRNRLSERLLAALGVALATTEMEMNAKEPRNPDILVGKVFDHNWELLSWFVPMGLFRGVVLGHFRRRVEYLVFANLSRLVAQWEETVSKALLSLENEASRRVEIFVATLESLFGSRLTTAPEIRRDIEKLAAIETQLSQSGL